MYPGQPEKLIGVVTYWPHLKQYRFLAAPSPGGFFAEAMPFVDKSVRSYFIIRFKSAECSEAAMFETWVNETETLRFRKIADMN
jgi:hypothetical protein